MEPKKPYGRSLSDFGALTSGERDLLDACLVGETVELGTSVPFSPTDENCVRADFLRFLMLGGDEQAPVHERGLSLRGAFVVGALILDGCHINVRIGLMICRFDDQIFAMDARLHGTLVMNGSHLGKGLIADRLYCSGGILLRDKFISRGKISLSGAQIGGDLSLRGSQIETDEEYGLVANFSSIKGNALLGSGFKTTSAVQFEGIQVGGNLNCVDGHFMVSKGTALLAQGAYIRGNVFLGSVENGETGGEESDANAIKIPSKTFEATGQVSLIGSQIDGDLDCRGGKFKSNGIAILADRSQIKGGVYFVNGFSATGEVRLADACIDGELLCNGGNFEGAENVASQAEGITVCSALRADGVKVKGNVSLGEGFRVKGQVNLFGAKIGGNLDCRGAQFMETAGYPLYVDSAIVKGTWFLSELVSKVCIKASHTEVTVLADSVDAWAPGSRLDGFRYAALAGQASTSGKDRSAWLLRQPESFIGGANFRPQPWRQLQRVLREMGHTEDAKQVGIEYEKHLREIGHVGQSAEGTNFIFAWWRRIIARGLHCGFGLLAAYGYRPIRLLTWMLGVWLGCAGLYYALAQQPFNAIAPSDPLVFQKSIYEQCRPNQLHTVQAEVLGNWTFCSLLPGEYSTFSALAYSLDLMLPVVDLGQEKSWGSYIPSPNESAANESPLNWRWGYLVRFVAWFETLFGWVSSLLLVAIISGFSRRNDEE